MAKKKKLKKKSHKSTKILTYVAWFLSIIALALSGIVAGYYFGYENGKTEVIAKENVEKEKRLALLQKLEKKVKKDESVNKRLQEVLQKEEKKRYTSAAHELDTKSLAKPPKPQKRKVVHTATKPKLAIIIDDVATRSQVKAIKQVGIPLTMSFLPPSKTRPNTQILAKNEKIYMIHLPMEALHWNKEEPFTLHVGDSQQKISQYIADLKGLFPRVKFINNHTGSKFTANEISMNRLVVALNENKISFIDSRTTAQTKAPKVMKNFGLKYMARDVFLDHHMEKSYVLKQIKLAVKTAKLHGTAIAIGHPHPNTLKALKESKAILREVNVVYINRLY